MRTRKINPFQWYSSRQFSILLCIINYYVRYSDSDIWSLGNIISYCPVKNAFTMEYDITSLINFQLMIQPAVYLISFAIAGNVPIHWYPWVHGSISYLEWYKQIFVGNRQKGQFNWYWMRELWPSWWYWVWNQ